LEGKEVSADAIATTPSNLAPEGTDFCLSPEEVLKGEQAVTRYIGSLKQADVRRQAEEALETLATVISGGVCDAQGFPWHQMRAYRGALALSIVKEPGAPAHVETLRCRRDEKRKYQVVPEAYPGKQIQKMKNTLKGVIAACGQLGYISEDEMLAAVPPPSAASKSAQAARPRSKDRTLSDGEARALLAACSMDSSKSGCRDALMICLGYMGGLRTLDLVSLTVDDLHFDPKRGQATLKVKQPQGKRPRTIPLENQELIALEDWLEARGRVRGPLFCPVLRGQKVDVKRMTAADLRDLCDKRAAEAGLQPFAPNDLAKSSTSNGGAARRRRARSKSGDASDPALAELSPLYGHVDVEPVGVEPERIRFPYNEKVGF
jgi:integrase